MRLVFMGTPGFAVPALQALHAAGHEIAAVYSQPPRPAGRGKKPRPSPVQAAAEALGLEVRTPERLRDAEAQAEFSALEADAGVVAAYGLILPRAVLDAPKLGCWNVHASLLPRWRGAAPVERAILAGDAETGVDVMRVEEGLDTGGIYAEERVQIGSDTTADELRAMLTTVGCRLLVEVVSRPVEEWIDEARPQVGEPLAASKLDKAEFEIDWTQTPVDVHRRIRVGGAWTTFRGKRLKIHSADLVDGRIVPIDIQPEGKASMRF